MKCIIKEEILKSLDINITKKESIGIIEDLNKNLVEPNENTKRLLKYLEKL